ncbi:Septal ring factor EnvC, activator of murein hydrolases AmiA and AmiB [Muriicola jejuensis]|uniref:Peptidoglycan DD-metalloendopeptidase family protein n=1 Tax=Muriicola jejuensis TaxID=504488 RepID=A0A6P0U991_9FLAO|nr:peptidoglycan DD-metalloendopeptidase family protein [Muriicola jejuensis]NER09871.1 peptidoglycan DD-metalloendopeptidase family protein [Muriicola jejuensis]SMP05093.1 Septal ring factor EnvC, activator of murein hydrolases AmiA and AmiB [Muriicola jejuensis]
MRTFTAHRLFILFAFLAFSISSAWSQTNEQKALEAKREQLQREISEMNRLLFAERKQRGTVLDQLELLDQKINVRQQLIRVTNQQSNLLSRQINANIRNIAKLREDLEILKDEYAQMIRKSYRNRSQQSRLMFLLSSQSFYQVFKRLQYLKQYTQYRKEQGLQIAKKTDDLIALNNELTEQRKEKEVLIAENKAARKELFEEMDEQKGLLKTIRQNESNYAAAINKKKAEAKKIDEQIERLIRSAIAASNKEAGNTSNTSKFVLTPEAAIIANNFSANKGRLIWPVEKGIKRQGFGIYSDAVYPGIKHQNNGVIIATEEGAKARAVFEGEVIAIMAVPGGGKGVQVKHGNYISVYYNLGNLYVKKGDKVTAKEELGEIFTNKLNGLTQLKFYLYRDAARLNPEEWIYQL